MSIEEIPLEEWQPFVESRPDATAFHHAQWLRLLSIQYRMPIRVLAHKQQGRVVAGLPFLETTSLRGKRKLISLPFTDFVRPLGISKAALSALCEGLRAADFRKYSRVVLKTDQPLGFRQHDAGVVKHELDLSPSLEHLERAYAQSVKRNVKKAQRSDLSFEIRNDASGLRTFYTLHLATRRKLGIPIQSRTYFDRFFQAMVEHRLADVALVTHGQVPIAAVVLLKYKERMIYKYAASSPDALDLRPNDFLVSRAIRHAAALHCKVFDFGTSRVVEEGLRRFKSKWGAVEVPIVNDCLRGVVPVDRGDSAMMICARTAIRRSPRIVCRMVGEILYRYSQ